MVFCNQCGAIMTGSVCPRCGFGGNSANSANAGSAGNAGFSGYAVDKGKIELLTKLGNYKRLLAENEELETMVKPQGSFPSTDEVQFKKRSFMKYFWPFLVAGPLLGYIIYFISTMITMNAINSYEAQSMTQAETSAATSRLMGDTMAGMVFALLVAAAIIVFGIIISKRKQADFNSNADFMNRQASERYQQGLANKRMLNLMQENAMEMHRYESLVPEDFRTSIRVGKIIELIKDDSAGTVEEACEMIKDSAPAEETIDTTGIFS